MKKQKKQSNQTEQTNTSSISNVSNNSNKVLVTGGAGYIGSVLVPALLHRSYQVTVLDNFMYNQTSLLDCCHHEGLHLIRGDVRNEKIIKKIIKGQDYIIPLACIVGAPACDLDPIAAKTINFDAIKLILKLRNKKQRIIFPNTNSGYGIGQKGLHCTERSPLKPVSLYGKLKVMVEKELLKSGNVVVLRLATVFGTSPRMRLDLLVNDFTHKAVHHGHVVLFEAHFKRNYIHIRDVVKAFMHAIDNFDNMKNNVYNIGLSNANLSKWELCEEIKKQVPNFYFTEAEVGKDPDKRNYIVSNAKIEKTGFKTDYSLNDGIAELIKGYTIFKQKHFTNI
jgi:nucleoside-diphosphate-sugar epimerase